MLRLFLFRWLFWFLFFVNSTRVVETEDLTEVPTINPQVADEIVLEVEEPDKPAMVAARLEGDVANYWIQNTYDIDFNTLVKHTMISGTTGMGKSTTCRRIINGVLEHNVPTLILEPAKDEYIQWAIDFNKKVDNDRSLSPKEKEERVLVI